MSRIMREIEAEGRAAREARAPPPMPAPTNPPPLPPIDYVIDLNEPECCPHGTLLTDTCSICQWIGSQPRGTYGYKMHRN